MVTLSNHVPRRLRLFGKEYQNTIWFAYSSPVSSVFWILTVLFKRDSNTKPLPDLLPVVTEAQVYWLFIFLAIGSYLIPAGVYWWKNRPFHVLVKWTPIEPDSTDHRLKRKNSVLLKPDEDSEGLTAEVLVTVLFDKSTKEYRLQFDSDGPLSVVPQYAPGNSEYDEENDVIVCDDVESSSFYFPLEISKDMEPSGVLDQYVYIKDSLNGNITILDIEII